MNCVHASLCILIELLDCLDPISAIAADNRRISLLQNGQLGLGVAHDDVQIFSPKFRIPLTMIFVTTFATSSATSSVCLRAEGTTHAQVRSGEWICLTILVHLVSHVLERSGFDSRNGLRSVLVLRKTGHDLIAKTVLVLVRVIS